MNDCEQQEHAALCSSWTDAALLAAVTTARGQHRPEVLPLIDAEVRRRKLALPAPVADVWQSANPTSKRATLATVASACFQRLRWKRLSWIGWVVLIPLAACVGGTEAPLVLPPRQLQWTVDPGNPVIQAGDLMSQGLWGDPSVLKVGDTYVMYMSSSTKEPFKPPILTFRAVSSDGLRWRLDPQTPLMDASGTPFVSIETPSVIHFRGKYHMYYTGIHPWGHSPVMEIGHASSDDGIHWVKDALPVVTSSGKVNEWTGYAVAEPGAVVYKDRVYLYFVGIGARPKGMPPQLQSIGLAISEDGRGFDKPRVVHTQTSRYPPAAGFPGYSTPSALVDGDTIHLFYDVVNFDKNAKPDWRQVALQDAVSTDGGMSFVERNGPLLRRDDNDWSAKGELIGPVALIDGNRVRLWFGGHVGYDQLGKMIRRGWKGREFGIGTMTTDLANLRKPAP